MWKGGCRRENGGGSEWVREKTPKSFILFYFILLVFVNLFLLIFFLISTWHPVIVHVDVTSSVNDKFNRYMKVSQNYNFMYHSGMKKTSCTKC